MANKLKLVMVGNGMAGVKCIEEIIKLAPGLFDITIFGSEPHPNYNRIMLSKVLQGDTTVDDITIHSWQWYRDNHIRLYAGETVTGIDVKRRLVTSSKGRTVPYDRLIVATGSLPFMLPLPGADKPGVTAFRDINDCQLMMETAKTYKKAIVIGGGLLGLEAARGLLNLGMEVDVVHIFHHLMERQLDATAAGMLKQELERQGMRFLLEKQTERIVGRKRAEGLLFKDGSRVAADLIVMAVGVRPNIRLAAESGIETNRAIVVNDYMETNVPDVYALGECAEHRGMVYGMVAPLYDQGKVLARKISGMAVEPYQGSILASQLKVSGVEVFSAGEIRDAEISTSIISCDGVRGLYRKIAVRDNKIVGAVLFGDTSEGSRLLGYIKQEADVSVLLREPEGNAAADELVANMPDKETVCSCNGVAKGTLVEAIRANGCETFEQVKACTKASSSCGGCKPLVSAILDYTLKYGEAPEPPKETVCACTSLSHEELKEAVSSQSFESVPDAVRQLGWQRQEGCDICLPALVYYIGLSHQLEHHRTIGVFSSRSGDDTWSITPRLYGGVTTSTQLRRIADVVDEHNIPLVKLSAGGQLDLLGIPAEQAEAVRSALAMPVVEAGYGKPVAVASCSGNLAADALRDVLHVSGSLERMLEEMPMPSSVAVGVSDSPLHRAGTLVKDVGLARVPGGWEIYVGGSGHARVRQAQLLCTEPTGEKAIRLCAAFLQWYREGADYGEPVWAWVERIGLLSIRESLFDELFRSTLLTRAEAGRCIKPSGELSERQSIENRQQTAAATSG